MTRAGLQLVVCGLGGQGTIFLSRVLAQAAMDEGRDVLTAETHGMSQRGGAVDCHVKLGGFAGSIVRQGCAGAVLALDAGRADAARGFLHAEGAGFCNAPAPADGLETCDATGLAAELGHPRGANLVLLGFAAAARPDLFPSAAALQAGLARLSPPAVREANRAAFARGAGGAS